MKIRSALLALTILSVGFISCEKTTDKPEPTPKTIELTAKAGQIIASGNNFGIDLFVKTAKDESKNLMLSPLSASVALTMALNGADGETHNQMKEMLGYPTDMTLQEINSTYKSLVGQLLAADEKVNISLANALFYRNGFSVKAPYISTIRDDFDAEVEGLDFDQPSAITTINKWAADNTNQKITKVIEEISAEAVMFLMNALYFKGSWTQKFDKALTTDQPFRLDDGTTVNVPTMAGKVGAIQFGTDSYKAAELPYGRKNFSMVVIVPNSTLNSFYDEFGANDWKEITSALDSNTNWSETNVLLPKFKFEYEKYLNEPLVDMGMVDAFNPSAADFSPISNTSIFISFVKQNTFVDVNEEGTEAAAVTTIGFELTSMPSTPTFVVDKPFIFAIRERTTNTLLFIGKISNPTL
jgi:serpin B